MLETIIDILQLIVINNILLIIKNIISNKLQKK